MEINNMIDSIISMYNTETSTFGDSIKHFEFKENNNKYYVDVCTKTMEIIQDNLTIELKKKLYNILYRKIIDSKNEKYISEYKYLYDYLEKTNKLDYIVEKRERPDFRIFNKNEQEYIEVTQDITRQEALIIKCLNSYYYGKSKYQEDYKKYLNIRKVSDGIIVGPKFKTSKKNRSENLFFSIKRKTNKYIQYIEQMPEIMNGIKSILVKMKSPYTITNKQKDIIQKRVFNMIQNTIVDKVIILTNDNELMIINRDYNI